MTAIRRQQREIERLQARPAVIPPGLLAAFRELESLDAGSTDARGMTYAGIRTAETRDCRAGMTREGRLFEK